MTTGPRFDEYRWSGGGEAMLRFGPDGGPVLVAVAPLFEEANRTRAVMVGVMRLLGQRGIAGAFPDLPGQGESLVPTEAIDLDTMRAALAAAVDATGGRRPVLSWSIRAGALVEDMAPVAARWRLSPVLAGRDLVRELARIRQAATGGRVPDLAAAGEPVEIAGSVLAPAMLRQLTAAMARRPARTVRLADDRREADHRVPGSPLWRQAEPADDPALVQRLADDIARWIATCAG